MGPGLRALGFKPPALVLQPYTPSFGPSAFGFGPLIFSLGLLALFAEPWALGLWLTMHPGFDKLMGISHIKLF